jgi:hypothetical protein
MEILRTLVLVCIAGWLAISTFFSFAVAPLAFRVIDRQVAGQLVSAVLPRYYDWGIILCAIALTAAAVQAVSGRRPRTVALAGVGLCGAMVCLLLWASIVLLPRAESARAARDDSAFGHRSSSTASRCWPAPRPCCSRRSACGCGVTAELEHGADAVGHRRRRLVSDRLASGEKKPRQSVRRQPERWAHSRRALDGLLEAQPDLLARPAERERRGLLPAGLEPGTVDLAGQLGARRERVGDPSEGRVQRRGGQVLRECQQERLGA